MPFFRATAANSRSSDVKRRGPAGAAAGAREGQSVRPSVCLSASHESGRYKPLAAIAASHAASDVPNYRPTRAACLGYRAAPRPVGRVLSVLLGSVRRATATG